MPVKHVVGHESLLTLLSSGQNHFCHGNWVKSETACIGPLVRHVHVSNCPFGRLAITVTTSGPKLCI